METSTPPGYRLYSPGQIAVAAFLGAPLAACWLWARDFQRLGQRSRSIQCLFGGIVGTIALLVLSFFLPERVPSLLIPLSYTLALYHAARYTHGTLVTRHLAAGGRLGSWWAVVGVSLISLLIVCVVICAVVLVIPEEYLPADD